MTNVLIGVGAVERVNQGPKGLDWLQDWQPAGGNGFAGAYQRTSGVAHVGCAWFAERDTLIEPRLTEDGRTSAVPDDWSIIINGGGAVQAGAAARLAKEWAIKPAAEGDVEEGVGQSARAYALLAGEIKGQIDQTAITVGEQADAVGAAAASTASDRDNVATQVGNVTTLLDGLGGEIIPAEIIFYRSASFPKGTILTIGNDGRIINVSPEAKLAEFEGELATTGNNVSDVTGRVTTLENNPRILEVLTYRSAKFAGGTLLDLDATGLIVGNPGGGSSGGGGTTPATSLEPVHYASSPYRTSIPARARLDPPVGQKVLAHSHWALGQSIDGRFQGELATHEVYKTAPENPDHALMLSAGIFPGADGTSNSSGLVSALEVIAGAHGDTGVTANMNRMIKLANAQHGYKPVFIGGIQAAGGQQLQVFLRGSTRYGLLMKNIGEAHAAAKTRGWDHVVMGKDSRQGNADFVGTDAELWKAMRLQQFGTFDQDVKRITGQWQDTHLWLGQPDTQDGTLTNGLIKAINDLVDMHPRIHHLPPYYDIPRDNTNSVHESSLGYLWGDERSADVRWIDYFGLGRPAFRPRRAYFITPTRIEMIVPLPAPATAAVKDPHGYITTANLPGGSANCGFEFDDYSGNPPAIVAVTLSTPTAVPATRIWVDLASPPAGPQRIIAYAMRGTGQDGPVTGARGTICTNYDLVATVNLLGQPQAYDGGGNPIIDGNTKYLNEYMQRFWLPIEG